MAEEMLTTQNAQQNELRDFVIFDAILNLIVETCRTGYCEEKSRKINLVSGKIFQRHSHKSESDQ
jgi:hypothetical protein